METRTFIRKKGIFTFKEGEHSLMTYDAEIRVVCEPEKVLSIQIQTTFDEEDARVIESSGTFPEITLPSKEDNTVFFLCLYLHGKEILSKYLLRILLERQPFINPTEAIVYTDSPMLPFFSALGFYELLKWKVITIE